MATSITHDRRKIADRRGLTAPPLFPFFDGEDTLVRQDRRSIPDRRINNIQVEENQPNPEDDIGDKRLFVWFEDEILEVQRDNEGFWLGRSNDCAARIASRFVSRQHARLYFDDDVYYLIDNSTNGTYIKNEEGEIFATKQKVLVRGSGVISLGVPFDHEDSNVIHYFIG